MSGQLTRTLFRPVLTLALCLGLALPALGFVPVSQNDELEITLPAFDLPGFSSYDRDMNSQSVEAQLTARLDGEWRVFSWNPQTNTPHWAYGTSTKIASGVGSESELVDVARQVVADHADVLGADNANLRVIATPHALGKWVAHFQQTFDGLDVEGAKVRIAISDDGKLILMGSDYYSGIDLDTTPSIDEASAIAMAKSAVGFNPATDSMDGASELLILPYPISETEVEHHLVWKLRVRTEDPLGIWVTHMDAHTGEILWRYNDIHFAYGGDTDTDVQIYGYCDGITNMTVPYLRIDVSGLGSVVADGNGDWSIAGTGGNRTVSCDMEGPYCDVYDNVQYPEAFFTGTAAENVAFTVDWNDTNAKQDERDVFDGVNDIHDFFQLVAPEFAYANAQIGAQVSLNSTCNAYWDGNIHFYREGGGCANTGEMQQVVHHEFGHGVQNAILGGQGGQGLGEGNGDILGNLMTQDSVIGRGFYLNNCTPSGGIRDSDNNLSYPGDVVGQEIHYAGQVIAGFNWDAMVDLQVLYGGGMNWNGAGNVIAGQNWHYGRTLLHPNTQPDQVFATFFADDDDNNMDNGTPNHAIYCQAAQNHGFDCPAILTGVLFSHTPLGDTTDTDNDYAVSAAVTSTEAPIDNVALFYRINGGLWVETPMNPTGGDNYAAVIPAQDSATIEYYLFAEDNVGTTGFAPSNAPASSYSFLVAWIIDTVESPSGWTVGAPDDNATTGVWERINPNGTAAQPEDDHTVVGTLAWITGQNSPGDLGGNDVDGGKTTLFSPVFDVSEALDVQVRYYRWFSNDQGATPGTDYWDTFVSNDGGTSWTAVEHTLNDNESWLAVDYDFTDAFPVPGQMQWQFVGQDQGEGSIVEAGVDDFVIMAIFALTGTDDGLTVSFLTDLGQNHPNPFNPRTAIKFSLEQAGPVSLRVFDVNGRVVRTLATGDMGGGAHEVIWDGTNESGTPLASGVYFYRLQADGKTMGKRMVLLK